MTFIGFISLADRVYNYVVALREIEQIILNNTQPTCKCDVCVELRRWLKKYKELLESE